jgi:hypothetical protein
VGKHVQAGRGDVVNRFNTLVREIGSEGFDEDGGCFLLDLGDGRCDVSGTAVGEI